jgi:polysaccharide export outer membrane protein
MINGGYMDLHFGCSQPMLRIANVATLLAFAFTGYVQVSAQVLADNSAGRSYDSSPASAAIATSKLDSKYVIGADDVLAIDVWHELELSRVLPVRPDGKISLPLIGELPASGQTPLQLQAIITGHLKEFLEHPQVTVIVQETKSQSFNVVGEVQRPGAFVFGHPMTVLDAIALAGGFRDFAKSTKMYVLRTTADGSRQRLPINYKDVIQGKKHSENIVLQSHDTVVVP